MDGQLAHVSNSRGAIHDRDCRGNPQDWDDEETQEAPWLDEEGDEDEEDEEEDYKSPLPFEETQILDQAREG